MKYFYLSLLVFISFSAFGQISLTHSNMDFSTKSYSLADALVGGVYAPLEGANQNWNYSSLSSFNIFNVEYYNLPSALIPFSNLTDTSIKNDLFLNISCYSNDYYVSDSLGVRKIGKTIEKQDYNIIPISLPGLNDSCKISQQFQIYNNPEIILEYPVTIGSKWTSHYKDTIHFILDLPTFSQSNIPCYRLRNITIKDSVVGWGKMTVPSYSLAPSMPYDVLMIKRNIVSIDSFNIGTSTGLNFILSFLGITQGGQEIDNSYVFWRENTGIPLINFKYGNSYYQNAIQICYDTDVSTVGISKPKLGFEEVNIYPNPAKDYVHIENINEANLEIYNMLGKKLYSSSNINDKYIVDLQNFKAGTYVVKIYDDKKIINRLINIVK